MDNFPHDHLALSGENVMIEDAREFLKTLAADGLDAYINRIWQMREPLTPKPPSKTGWPIMTSSARMDYECRLGLMPRKNLKVLK